MTKAASPYTGKKEPINILNIRRPLYLLTNLKKKKKERKWST